MTCTCQNNSFYRTQLIENLKFLHPDHTPLIVTTGRRVHIILRKPTGERAVLMEQVYDGTVASAESAIAACYRQTTSEVIGEVDTLRQQERDRVSLPPRYDEVGSSSSKTGTAQ